MTIKKFKAFFCRIYYGIKLKSIREEMTLKKLIEYLKIPYEEDDEIH